MAEGGTVGAVPSVVFGAGGTSGSVAAGSLAGGGSAQLCVKRAVAPAASTTAEATEKPIIAMRGRGEAGWLAIARWYTRKGRPGHDLLTASAPP